MHRDRGTQRPFRKRGALRMQDFAPALKPPIKRRCPSWFERPEVLKTKAGFMRASREDAGSPDRIVVLNGARLGHGKTRLRFVG